MTALDSVRIVLVETTHPGNIGATARAMKNMGLSDLTLVRPKTFPSEEALARASGADDLLESARVVDTLEAALSDRALVIGASARRRSIAWPELDPHEAAERVLTRGVPTALLFGREHSGLTNEELERCHFLLHIPTVEHFSSLNVAAAVQVVCYELFRAAAATAPGTTLRPLQEVPADGAAMASFQGHLERVLEAVGFLHETKHPQSIRRRLHRLFNRAAPSVAELHLLRGILTRIERALSIRD